MKLYIPKLGDELKLTKDWKFKLQYEHRNNSLTQALFGKNWSEHYLEHSAMNDRMGAYDICVATLPKDTILKVDRIYIRQGSEDYDSVTFRISDCPNKKLNKKRFWVKLDDANELEFESVVFNKKVKMQWRGWLRNIKTGINLKQSFDATYDFINPSGMDLTIDGVKRFVGKIIVEKLEATEDNWLKAGLNKIYLGHTNTYPNGLYPTLAKYFKYFTHRGVIWTKLKPNDYVIMVVSYELSDLKTNEKYIFKTSESLKTKARSIIKKEYKSGN